jgi:2-amino-5-formylamino-6-ribosylaminopyrimidin-4(3H)-one 5'-monophosphate deformylase
MVIYLVKLRYSSGNILSPEVHKIGILALGSHLENHGVALPIDTDAKIASYLALHASLRTGAKFLGILYAATEYDYINHGKHVDVDELIQKNLIPILKTAKRCLNIESIVLVNGHGGNKAVISYLQKLENELKLKIIINNKIVEIEGPHAWSGEVSIGSFLKIVDESKINEHNDFGKYPEVGMVGFSEARKINTKIDQEANSVKTEELIVDKELGKSLLEIAIEDIIQDIQKFIKE